MKTKTITLETWETLDPEKVPQMVRRWRVLKVTDSIEFHPDDQLNKAQVEELCESKIWKVTITALS